MSLDGTTDVRIAWSFVATAEKEIAIPAFREHLYGTEIVTALTRARRNSARKRELKRRLLHKHRRLVTLEYRSEVFGG